MARADTRNYDEWISDLLSNPASCGAKGWFFYLVALPMLIVCGLAGLSVFPPGRYPKLVLIAPGLIIGAVAIAVFGWLMYKLPTFLAVLLSLILAVPGYFLAYSFVMDLLGDLRRAF